LSIEEIKMDSTISTKDLKLKLDKKQGITVVETLAPERYREAHLPGALNIPPEKIREPPLPNIRKPTLQFWAEIRRPSGNLDRLGDFMPQPEVQFFWAKPARADLRG
jgi:predicted alpha/beta-hydrolase family hydrolase